MGLRARNSRRNDWISIRDSRRDSNFNASHHIKSNPTRSISQQRRLAVLGRSRHALQTYARLPKHFRPHYSRLTIDASQDVSAAGSVGSVVCCWSGVGSGAELEASWSHMDPTCTACTDPTTAAAPPGPAHVITTHINGFSNKFSTTGRLETASAWLVGHEAARHAQAVLPAHERHTGTVTKGMQIADQQRRLHGTRV